MCVLSVPQVLADTIKLGASSSAHLALQKHLTAAAASEWAKQLTQCKKRLKLTPAVQTGGGTKRRPLDCLSWRALGQALLTLLDQLDQSGKSAVCAMALLEPPPENPPAAKRLRSELMVPQTVYVALKTVQPPVRSDKSNHQATEAQQRGAEGAEAEEQGAEAEAKATEGEEQGAEGEKGADGEEAAKVRKSARTSSRRGRGQHLAQSSSGEPSAAMDEQDLEEEEEDQSVFQVMAAGCCCC